jgi:L-threonine kinase
MFDREKLDVYQLQFPSLTIGGKIGEWAQGVDEAGCPVIYSLTVTKSPFNTRTVIERSGSLSVRIHPETPENNGKTERAVLALARRYGFTEDCRYRIVIRDSPPRGKGLGSSSIDMASALRAVREFRALNTSKDDLYKIMCGIERSDYLFDPQFIVAANPLDGMRTLIRTAPECLVLAWDTEPGKTVTTEALAHLDRRRQPLASEYRDVFAMIETGDISSILEATTRSAEINDGLLAKVGFRAAHQLVKELGRIGLAAAHTGTWLGFILPHPIDHDALQRISEFFAERIERTPVRFETGTPIF